jgi:hypothetical protein
MLMVTIPVAILGDGSARLIGEIIAEQVETLWQSSRYYRGTIDHVPGGGIKGRWRMVRRPC